MKSINNYIEEALIKKDTKLQASIDKLPPKRAKQIERLIKNKITTSDCPGYCFDWIGVKDHWVPKGDPCMHYALICYPFDENKNIVVLCDYAWYEGGYDQGYASSRQLYLSTILGGGRGNGHGQPRETEPYYLEPYEWKDLYEYLTKGTHWSGDRQKQLDKRKIEFPPNTKKSEIKQKLIH